MALNDPPSSFNLQLMNLFLGMCRGVAGLPRDLRHLGYSDKWIEYRFSNSLNQTVVPELILASRGLRHSLLLEWKSGPNTDADQLRRYSGVNSEDLRMKAMLTREESQSHDIVLIGQAEFSKRLVVAIDRDGHPFPVLVRSAEGLDTIRNRFRPDELDTVFRPRLALDWERIPTFLFPLDKDSEVWSFAELMIPKILEQMAQGAPRILLMQLAEAIVPCWSIVDRPYQHELEQKMVAVMNEACRREFRTYLRRNRAAEGRTHTPTWDIISNPLAEISDRRQREWKRMRSRQESLLQFLQTGEQIPEQEELPLE